MKSHVTISNQNFCYTFFCFVFHTEDQKHTKKHCGQNWWTSQFTRIGKYKCEINWVTRNFIERRANAHFYHDSVRHKITIFFCKYLSVAVAAVSFFRIFIYLFINKVCLAHPSTLSLRIHFHSVTEIKKKIKLNIFHRIVNRMSSISTAFE